MEDLGQELFPDYKCRLINTQEYHEENYLLQRPFRV